MKRKLIAVLVALMFVCAPYGAYAQDSVAVVTIPASGSLTLPAEFDAVILGSTQLNFLGDQADLIAESTNATSTADVVVELQFDYLDMTSFQAVLISTRNRNNNTGNVYTGTGTGAGLVNQQDTTVAAPLHWTIFATQSEAVAWQFVANADGNVENAYQYYVVDRDQSLATPPQASFTDPLVLSYASIIYDIQGLEALLANCPKDATGTVGGTGAARTVTNGRAYLKLACDYNGQPAGTYITDTLTVDLATLS